MKIEIIKNLFFGTFMALSLLNSEHSFAHVEELDESKINTSDITYNIYEIPLSVQKAAFLLIKNECKGIIPGPGSIAFDSATFNTQYLTVTKPKLDPENPVAWEIDKNFIVVNYKLDFNVRTKINPYVFVPNNDPLAEFTATINVQNIRLLINVNTKEEKIDGEKQFVTSSTDKICQHTDYGPNVFGGGL